MMTLPILTDNAKMSNKKDAEIESFHYPQNMPKQKGTDSENNEVQSLP